MDMKKYLFIAASALALASCSSEDFVGTEGGNVENGANKAIGFGGKLGKITRANDHVGADAAKLLDNKFIVAGFKGETPTSGITTTKVFDHYTVEWEASTAGTTADNTSDWKYVGSLPQSGLASISGSQTIKYWDYSTSQYDFIAFSAGKAKIVTDQEPVDGEVKVTRVDATKATSAAYTIKGKADDLHKCYIADLITAYNPKIDGKPEYQKEVQLSFRNLTSKVRVAFYETIPGYSVKDVKFYTDNSTKKNKNVSKTEASLFTEGNQAYNKFYSSGTATVYFPNVGKAKISNSDYNKAHVTITGTDADAKTLKDFGTLNYTNSEDSRLNKENEKNNIYLATTSSKATFAGATDTHYQIVIPNETGTTLTLRVNYTLVANDGSGEEINVYGAKAIVPAIYAQWKSNYAYTYIFKISDKTNGMTDINNGPEGLYPITFDAVVADSEIGNQTTITTVATPSITTYQKGHDIKKDEYKEGDIYVMATDKDGILIKDLDKANLYTVEGATISEATVHDALTIGSTTNAENNTITGRNGITLTKAEMSTNFTTVPGVDENDITVTAKTAAKFNAKAGIYAFVYETTPTPAPASTQLHTAITFDTETDLTGKGYYTDEACDTLATGKSKTNTVYYQKITNTNKTYAIKVIKVVE